jgi:cytochrome c peroxidase
LGLPNNLAAYVSSLSKVTVKRSSYRNPLNGELSIDGLLGQQTFLNHGCASCHSGKAFRDSLAYDLGTINPNYNKAYGEEGGLVAVRTPTLIDLLETAPYFHNGSVDTLEQVLE